MGGYELRVWRVGMGWTQELAAEELGVGRRTYIAWEKSGPANPLLVELATRALSLRAEWPETAKRLKVLSTIARH